MHCAGARKLLQAGRKVYEEKEYLERELRTTQSPRLTSGLQAEAGNGEEGQALPKEGLQAPS